MQSLFLAASIMKDKSPSPPELDQPRYAGRFEGVKDLARVGAALGGIVVYAGILTILLAP